MNRKIIEQALALADDVCIGSSAQHSQHWTVQQLYGQLHAIQGLLYFELAADDIRLEKLNAQPVQPVATVSFYDFWKDISRLHDLDYFQEILVEFGWKSALSAHGIKETK